MGQPVVRIYNAPDDLTGKWVRAEQVDALREQNRVLRSNLVNCAARLEAYYGEDYPAVRDAKAALTATSQEGQG